MIAGRDPFSLEGKRILVTGASSGIGQQIALTCAQLGAQLIISGRNEERLHATMDLLEGEGHIAVAADLTQADQLTHLVERGGVLDGLVHAAGVSRLVPFRLIGKQHLDEIFGSNTFAPMLLTKALLAKKQIAAGGSILFIAALASHSGALATSVYAASKSALLGAMRSLALEVAKQGIRANCISPGYVRTPMLDGLGLEIIDPVPSLFSFNIGAPEALGFVRSFAFDPPAAAFDAAFSTK